MPPVNQILLAEDDPALRENICAFLEYKGYAVTAAENGDRALELLGRYAFHLVVTDLRMPGADGMEVLAYVLANMPDAQVIMMSGYGTVDEAVQAMHMGAFDFHEKPLNLEHLALTIERALERGALGRTRDYLRHEQPIIYNFGEIMACSPEMKKILDMAAKVAATDATVLITGETGTGKSLIAGAIHANSARREGTLVTVNCAALAENLLESELFGHEKGSFTGAHKSRTGRFQQAHGSSLFLDEVGDMSQGLQAKVLRAIEDKEIQKVGGSRSIRVDVRILAATNVELEQAVEDGRFRSDLFYRLNVASLDIPPLRERTDDIIPLAELFVRRLCYKSGKQGVELSEQAKLALVGHSWPGNTRELRNVVERALLFCAGEEIGAQDLGLDSEESKVAGVPHPNTFNLADLEKWAIENSLESCDWVQSRAAKKLGISPRALSYKLDKLAGDYPKLEARRRKRS